MEFLVQDLLDFAQIKAGKFRKNITNFSIKDAIDQVIDIQSYKAEKQGIELKTEYLNIDEDDQGCFSPYIKSDMTRI